MEFKCRDYEAERKRCELRREIACTHPLASPIFVKSSSSSQNDFADSDNSSFTDPLAATISDPLSSVDINQSSTFEKSSSVEPSGEVRGTRFKEWDAYKRLMLNKYKCTDTISLSLTSDIMSVKGHTKSLTAMHLDEINESAKDSDQEQHIVSQQEYMMRLQELNYEIVEAWQRNDRVSSLKLSVKVARLLADTSVPQFYPTLFISVTDILDSLGQLVWKRITEKVEFDDDGTRVYHLPEHFTYLDVTPEAKDTCKNWFYKIGSIRDLLPRIYLEMAILRCMHFLEGSPLSVCRRLTLMIRGLADPLVSAYAYLYLVRCASGLITSETGYLISALMDFLRLVKRTFTGSVNSKLEKSICEKKLYFRLIEPVIEWFIQCIFSSADQQRKVTLLGELGILRNDWKPIQNIHFISALLYYLLKELPAVIISDYALGFLRLAEVSIDLSMPQHLNYRLLGFRLCECNLSKECSIFILGEILKVVTEYSKLNEYLMVIDAYIDFVLQNGMEEQLRLIVDDIFDHLQRSAVHDDELKYLEAIILKLSIHFRDLPELIALDHFMDILHVCSGSTRNFIYKNILSLALRCNQMINDGVMRKTLFDISKALHDSISIFNISNDNDSNEISNLLKRFLQRVDFQGDFEYHLSFLINCRTAFYNMDIVKETLTRSSNLLAIMRLKATEYSDKHHVTEFLKGCIAFNEVTISSIKSPLVQTKLYLETAEVAMQGALLAHTDYLIMEAISCLQEIQESTEYDTITDYMIVLTLIQKLAGFLIVIPGHPLQGGVFLLKRLLELLYHDTWMTSGLRSVQLLCAIIFSISALSQKHLPYHTKNNKVFSNDTLYFGDVSYKKELILTANDIAQRILQCLDKESTADKHGNLALYACNCFLIAFKPSKETLKHNSRLIESAKSSLHINSRFLELTIVLIRKMYGTD